jgi:hypothetical protein
VSKLAGIFTYSEHTGYLNGVGLTIDIFTATNLRFGVLHNDAVSYYTASAMSEQV